MTAREALAAIEYLAYHPDTSPIEKVDAIRDVLTGYYNPPHEDLP
jgi:hypothetical protein